VSDMEVTGATPSNQIAGAWRRLFAFLLDGLLLGVLGFSLGLVAHDDLVALGDWGRAVGFAIALTYFNALHTISCRLIEAGEGLGFPGKSACPDYLGARSFCRKQR
jgi:uncharacterized RDD family membrane protein YckC